MERAERPFAKSAAKFLLFVMFVAGAQLLGGGASWLGAGLLTAFGVACGAVLLGGPILVERLGHRPSDDPDNARTVDLARAACSPQRVLVSRALQSDVDGAMDIVPRIRPVLAARLARDHGLDLDDPADRNAIADVIGPNAVVVLATGQGSSDRLDAALDECADFLGVTS